MEKWVPTLQKITDTLNSFLEPFECEAVAGTDFSFWIGSNTIEYTLVVSEVHIQSFIDFTSKLFPNIKADPFLWSIMHEIGHRETEDDFEDEEWEEYQNTVSDLKSGKDDETYYNLPIEYAATYWAGNYMTEHVEEVATLWNKLKPLIAQFYRETEVER